MGLVRRRFNIMGGGRDWRRVSNPMVLISDVICPACGYVNVEIMPPARRIQFVDCLNCGQKIGEKPGDHCVFCSHGSVRCPEKQGDRGGGIT